MKNNRPVRINRKYLRSVKSFLAEIERFDRLVESRKAELQ